MSQLGLSHAPAPWSHGGVLVEQEIRRDATLNLEALRAFSGGPDGKPLALRRYLLGLALVAFTAPQETFLREGCQLIPDEHKPAEWRLVRHDGRREDAHIPHGQALAFAKAAASDFGIGPARTATFDGKRAKAELNKSKEERKKSRRTAKDGEGSKK